MKESYLSWAWASLLLTGARVGREPSLLKALGVAPGEAMTNLPGLLTFEKAPGMVPGDREENSFSVD